MAICSSLVPNVGFVRMDSQQGTATITSDASIKGWGAVLVVDGVMRATGKRWGLSRTTGGSILSNSQQYG